MNNVLSKNFNKKQVSIKIPKNIRLHVCFMPHLLTYSTM